MNRLLCIAVCMLGLTGQAHQLGVDRVTLQELADNQYRLAYNVQPGTPEALNRPVLPPRCQWDESAGTTTFAAGLLFTTADKPLGAGDTILLPWRRNGVIFAVFWKDGSQAQQFFLSGPEGIAVELSQLKAGSGGFASMAKRYIQLGIEHIGKGLDHLLFVAGLLMLVRGRRRLLLAITAFTLAHSITLALSVLGHIKIELALVDCIIALSIVFLAAENLHVQKGRMSLSARWPWIASFGFGLIHGVGFADALNALGMPQREIPPALLCFNVGVELGQLMFVAVWFAVLGMLRRLACKLPTSLLPAPAYALGIAGAWWFVERLVALFAFA
jgi:HupE / UreJ protein